MGVAIQIAQPGQQMVARMPGFRSGLAQTPAVQAGSWHDVPIKLDDIDRRILTVLQRDGRISNVELAREVGLSPSPCLRRVRLLEEAGIIIRYAALLDAARVGMGLTVFVRVWLTGQDEETVERFVARVREAAQVVECHLMAGDCDFLLRVVAADLDSYRRFQAEQLARIEGVRSLKTDIPMQTIKQSPTLPLEPEPLRR